MDIRIAKYAFSLRKISQREILLLGNARSPRPSLKLSGGLGTMPTRISKPLKGILPILIIDAMPKEILEKLFDSPVKVKLLKLFLRNPGSDFKIKEVIRRTKSDSLTCRTQLKKLEEAQLLKCRIKDNKKIYSIDPNFVFYEELKTLILKSSPASKQRIMKRLKTLGNVKLAVISGIFINAENSRIDFLLVGDRLDKKKIGGFFKDLEAEVGKEIDYVVLTGEEFSYRYNMFDRFLLDVLEKPHEKLVNKLKI